MSEFDSSRSARIAAGLAVLLAVVPWQFWTYLGLWFSNSFFALLGLTAVLALNQGKTSELGFRLSPDRGWSYWCRIAVSIGLAVGLFGFLSAAVALTMKWPFVISRASPDRLPGQFQAMCLSAPLVEEVLFRQLLTEAVRKTVGDAGTILISGLVFAAMHWLAGIASPENQIGGFFLAWAYLRSRSILVPMAMHSAGNFMALIAQVIGWTLVPGPEPVLWIN